MCMSPAYIPLLSQSKDGGKMDLLANSAVANVEAAMTFTLATKFVDGMLALEQKPWVLGSMCLIVLSVVKSSKQGRMGSQILMLAFSRLLLLQVCENQCVRD